MNAYNWFKVRFATFRNNAELSQAEIAKKIGVSKAFVSMVEQGIKPPTFRFVLSLASKYHLSVDYLFGISDEPLSNNGKRKSDKEIGKTIQAKRKSLNMPQYIFADTIKLDRRSLDAIEKGKSRIKIKSAILLAETYKISYDELFFHKVVA